MVQVAGLTNHVPILIIVFICLLWVARPELESGIPYFVLFSKQNLEQTFITAARDSANEYSSNQQYSFCFSSFGEE
jgi:hypothetical protein